MDRYKDYQVPVIRLKTSGRLASKIKLPDSALQVVADTPEAEARLDALAGEDIALEGVSVDLSNGTEEFAKEPAVSITSQPTPEEGSTSTVEEASSAKLESEATSEEKKTNTAGTTTRTRKRKSKAKDAVEGEAKVQSKFVNLVDLLPPLPKKGDFDVQTIKKSQYFFS